jgi:sulfur carrier protein
MTAPQAGPVPGGTRVTVNGAARTFAAAVTVADVVAAEVADVRGVAVAVNGELVPRSTWPDAGVAEGDRIELLTAAQGG